MNEHDLTTALEQRAGDVVVGVAPLDSMTRAAGRTRRRRAIGSALGAAAAITAVTVGVVAVQTGDDGAARDRTPLAAPTTTAAATPGFRLVGMGVVAIAVPDAWPRDATSCGQPNETTYVVDPYSIQCDMFVPFPADSDEIRVAVAPSEVPEAWTPYDLDGTPAYRSPTETGTPDPASGEVPVSRASVLVPDAGVLFTVSSSVSQERVAELLDGVHRLEGRTGVPGFRDLELLQYEGGSRRADEVYRERLEAAGLVLETAEQTDRRRYEPGTVIAVTPEPGTVLEPGATVRVVVAR